MMKTSSRAALSRRSLLGALMLFAVAQPAKADSDEADENPGHDEAGEHEYALGLVKNGGALPLADILVEVQKTIPGDLLEARLKKRHGIVVYVLSLLSKDGTYSVVTVNAKNKSIVSVEDR